ncbi:MAG TPA: aminotransferase class IV [Solirubrobacteraceae bacterium]|nr:aminotransferase class IV [Solirubrobacteraceae bacterium]
MTTDSHRRLRVDPDSAAPGEWPAVLDGELMRTAEAMIPATDDGLIRGDGAFDAFLVRDGRPFARGAHMDRLERSCAALQLPFSRPEVEQDIDRLLTVAPPGDVVVRVILTRGGRRLCRLEGLGDTDALIRPVRLLPVVYDPSVVLNGVKTLSYAANMLASRRALTAGYGEALLVRSDGTVLEGPTCSVFWVRHGRLRTPALGTGILASITRRVIMDSLSVEEGTYSFEEVVAAEEAFLASTARLAQPIAAIGETALPVAPGALTRRAQDVLQRAIDQGLLA